MPRAGSLLGKESLLAGGAGTGPPMVSTQLGAEAREAQALLWSAQSEGGQTRGLPGTRRGRPRAGAAGMTVGPERPAPASWTPAACQPGPSSVEHGAPPEFAISDGVGLPPPSMPRLGVLRGRVRSLFCSCLSPV